MKRSIDIVRDLFSIKLNADQALDRFPRSNTLENARPRLRACALRDLPRMYIDSR